MQQCRIAGALLVAFIACGIVWGQDAAKPTTRGQSAKESAPAEKLSGRLPNNYGKIGLSDSQKQKIYGIQQKYNDQIESLTKQIEELRSKRDGDVEGVLTAEQKEKLKSLMKDKASGKAANGGK